MVLRYWASIYSGDWVVRIASTAQFEPAFLVLALLFQLVSFCQEHPCEWSVRYVVHSVTPVCALAAGRSALLLRNRWKPQNKSHWFTGTLFLPEPGKSSRRGAIRSSRSKIVQAGQLCAGSGVVQRRRRGREPVMSEGKRGLDVGRYHACSENTWGDKSGADRRRSKVCVCVDSKAREDLITKKQDLWTSFILVRLDTITLCLAILGNNAASRLRFWCFYNSF